MLLFELRHNNSRIIKETLLTQYNISDLLLIKGNTTPMVEKSILSSFSEMYPEEKLDPLITRLPAPDRICSSSRLGLEDNDDEDEDDGELPDDLTPTEMILNKFIWGEADRFLTILLVATLEDMSIGEVVNSLVKMKMH